MSKCDHYRIVFKHTKAEARGANQASEYAPKGFAGQFLLDTRQLTILQLWPYLGDMHGLYSVVSVVQWEYSLELLQDHLHGRVMHVICIIGYL